MTFLKTLQFATAVFVSAAAWLPRAADAQSPGAASLYGRGVHAYFRGNSSQAESYLSSALALNPHDPRAYYFRGLALLRLGRSDEARGDMIVGARLEASQPGRYGIGTALQRVQGSDRLLLERYRQQARTEAQNERVERRRQRYQQTSANDQRVLRRPITVSLDELLPGGGPRLSAAASISPEPQPVRPDAQAQPLMNHPDPSTTTPREPASIQGNPFIDDPALEGDQPARAPSSVTGTDTPEQSDAANEPESDQESPQRGEELFGTEDENPFAID